MIMGTQAGANMLTGTPFGPLAAKATPSLALTGVLGGLAGGLAEVAWIGLYSEATGANGFDIIRRVADTVFPGILRMDAAPSVGFAIHFGLSAALGFVLSRPLTSIGVRQPGALLPICMGILGLVWCMNFMFILPVINPTFPLLLPIWVTFASKLLFGAALAGFIGHRNANVAFSPSLPRAREVR